MKRYQPTLNDYLTWTEEQWSEHERQRQRGLFFIGTVRYALFLPGSWKWNAWVRDITAKLEGGWLIRSAL